MGDLRRWHPDARVIIELADSIKGPSFHLLLLIILLLTFLLDLLSSPTCRLLLSQMRPLAWMLLD